jgi:hypothetical protein
MPYGSVKSSAVRGAVCPSIVFRQLGQAFEIWELTMKATPEGSSSCSEGKKAGPLRLLELR